MMQNIPPPVPSSLPQKNPIAVWSLVLGIMAMFGCFLCMGVGGLFFAIPAVICAHKARTRIRRSGNIEGDGISLAGMIVGYIAMGLALLLMPIMLAIAIPAFVTARERAMETACANNLRQIGKGRLQYEADHNGTPAVAMSDLVPKYILKEPACPKKGVYSIGGKDEAPSCSIHGSDPMKPRSRRSAPIKNDDSTLPEK